LAAGRRGGSTDMTLDAAFCLAETNENHEESNVRTPLRMRAPAAISRRLISFRLLPAPLRGASCSAYATTTSPSEATLVPETHDDSPTSEAAATAIAARLRRQDAAAACAELSAVDGVGKLRARIRRDLKRVLSRPSSAAGARNNARGYASELAVARHAPAPLVAVCASASAAGGGGRRAGSSPSPSSSSVEVDVVCDGGATWIEVKAHQPFGTGSAHWAGGGAGGGGGNGGLKAQVEALLAAAGDPSNRGPGFRAPRLAVCFSRGVDPSVARELERMGAIPLGRERPAVTLRQEGGGDKEEDEDDGNGGDDDDDDDDAIDAACRAALATLPPLPPDGAPFLINLDVTALCALVSEVSWSGGSSAAAALALDRWAARTPHWRDCLAAERADPLLFCSQGRRRWRADKALARAGRRLFGEEEEEEEDGAAAAAAAAALPAAVLASAAAVRQFEALAAMHAGPREMARWQRLRAGLEIVGQEEEEEEEEDGEERGGAAAAAPAAALAGPREEHNGKGSSSSSSSSIITTMASATGLALSVLSLGGARRAVTVTGNGAAVRSAREHWARRRQRLRRAAGAAVGGGGGGQVKGGGGGGRGDGGPGAAADGWTDDAAAGALEAEVHRAVWLAGM
jgi:hypothetical protein